MSGIPIIRLELQQMRSTVHMALLEHQALMDEQIKIALDAALQPEAVQRVLSEAVRSSVNAAISEEVRSAFQYSGPGRKALREAVAQFMDERYGDQPS